MCWIFLVYYRRTILTNQVFLELDIGLLHTYRYIQYECKTLTLNRSDEINNLSVIIN